MPMYADIESILWKIVGLVFIETITNVKLNLWWSNCEYVGGGKILFLLEQRN